MEFDWEGLRTRRPRVARAIVVLKRLRTKVGFVLVAGSTIEAFWNHERPYDLDGPWNLILGTGMFLILIGVSLRFWTLGFLHKKEELATSGPYSLCRHPLYLSSIVLTAGFCFLLRDVGNFVGAAIYFAVFYSITIIWEEVRLRQRYGEEHERYCADTPILIPMGRFRVGSFGTVQALSNGGLQLVVAIVLCLIGVEAMAEYMP